MCFGVTFEVHVTPQVFMRYESRNHPMSKVGISLFFCLQSSWMWRLKFLKTFHCYWTTQRVDLKSNRSQEPETPVTSLNVLSLCLPGTGKHPASSCSNTYYQREHGEQNLSTGAPQVRILFTLFLFLLFRTSVFSELCVRICICFCYCIDLVMWYII